MVSQTGFNHVDGEGHPVVDPQSSFGRFSKFHAHGKLDVIHILKAMNSVIHRLVLYFFSKVKNAPEKPSNHGKQNRFFGKHSTAY